VGTGNLAWASLGRAGLGPWAGGPSAGLGDPSAEASRWVLGWAGGALGGSSGGRLQSWRRRRQRRLWQNDRL